MQTTVATLLATWAEFQSYCQGKAKGITDDDGTTITTAPVQALYRAQAMAEAWTRRRFYVHKRVQLWNADPDGVLITGIAYNVSLCDSWPVVEVDTANVLILGPPYADVEARVYSLVIPSNNEFTYYAGWARSDQALVADLQSQTAEPYDLDELGILPDSAPYDLLAGIFEAALYLYQRVGKGDVASGGTTRVVVGQTFERSNRLGLEEEVHEIFTTHIGNYRRLELAL